MLEDRTYLLPVAPFLVGALEELQDPSAKGMRKPQFFAFFTQPTNITYQCCKLQEFHGSFTAEAKEMLQFCFYLFSLLCSAPSHFP